MIEKINEKENDYTFIICWKVRDNGDISKHIRRLKEYKNVYFEWQVGRIAIQDVFLQAGTFILPSRTEIYNQTIMEALFYGCNVICTDVWAAREQLWACTSAYILPNSDDFISKGLEILSHMKNSYEKSVSAYQYANKKFNSNIWRKSKMDFLNGIFSKKT
jgi:glycosyltransferase involved in cell wall biosynthesis